jgi:hypothetical protein
MGVIVGYVELGVIVQLQDASAIVLCIPLIKIILGAY